MGKIHFPIQTYLAGQGLPVSDAYHLPELPHRFLRWGSIPD